MVRFEIAARKTISGQGASLKHVFLRKGLVFFLVERKGLVGIDFGPFFCVYIFF